MTQELQSAEQERLIAEHKLAATRASLEAKALERTRALIEAPQPVVVPWSEYPGFDDFSRWPSSIERPYIWSDMEDRTEGRYRPIYETEQDLRVIRAAGRRFYAAFPVAQGIIESTVNYEIGAGYNFVVKPKPRYEHDPNAAALVPILQAVVDRFLEHNRFVGHLDREIHKQSRIDGEAAPTLYPDDRDVRVELIDPDYILQPAKPEGLDKMLRQSHKLNFWWHGVHTQWNPHLKRDDVSRPLGYHVVFDKYGEQWDYLPASRVEHIKRNVGPGARRGVTDYWIIRKDLESEAKIRRNTAEGAAILAAIVMIRQHAEGVSKSSIESMVSGNATSTISRPTQSGSRPTSSENVQPGTVKDIPYGMTHTLGPMGTLRSPIYIEVAQYLQRVMGTPRSTPEYLVSGDASNANYASTLVAEGPFVKSREHGQRFDALHFESLLWKAMLMYAKIGVLAAPWQMLREMLDIKAEYTSPASRDKKEQADVNKILHDAGIMSKRTWAADSGLDLDEEIANGAKEAPPEPSPFGIPGQSPPALESERLNSLAAQALTALTEAAK